MSRQALTEGLDHTVSTDCIFNQWTRRSSRTLDLAGRLGSGPGNPLNSTARFAHPGIICSTTPRTRKGIGNPPACGSAKAAQWCLPMRKISAQSGGSRRDGPSEPSFVVSKSGINNSEYVTTEHRGQTRHRRMLDAWNGRVSCIDIQTELPDLQRLDSSGTHSTATGCFAT